MSSTTDARKKKHDWMASIATVCCAQRPSRADAPPALPSLLPRFTPIQPPPNLLLKPTRVQNLHSAPPTRALAGLRPVHVSIVS